MSLPVHTLYGISPSKGVEGDLFITYAVVISASTQNVSDNIACANILRTRSMIVWFILLASHFNFGIFGTVYSIQTPFDRQYSSNRPSYSPSLSARTTFSFWPVSLSTLTWNSLKTESTLSGYYTNAWWNEAGPRRSCTKEQARKGKEREPATCDRRYTGTRPSDTEDTNRHRHRETQTNKYVY